MTREQAKELLPIIQAFADGKTIQFKSIDDKWDDFGNKEDKLSFDSPIHKYRIKPEPKYRPFKDAKECWNEIQKHQPFGWVKARYGYFIITGLSYYGIAFGIDGIYREYKYMYNECTFADGTPFGIKE